GLTSRQGRMAGELSLGLAVVTGARIATASGCKQALYLTRGETDSSSGSLMWLATRNVSRVACNVASSNRRDLTRTATGLRGRMDDVRDCAHGHHMSAFLSRPRPYPSQRRQPIVRQNALRLRLLPRKGAPMKFPCPLISATAALFVCTVVSAQTPPSAGALHQQVEEGRVSRESEASPALRIESGTADSAGASGQQKVLVNSLRITGARMFSETQLIAVAGLNAGRELALSDLHAMAARITGYYRDRGYPLSRAYLPAQESGGGEITI